MQALLRLASAVDRMNALIGRAALWLTLVMVLLGFASAVLRDAGQHLGRNLSSNMALEAQWYMFSLVFLLVAPYALQKDAHVRVDVLYSRLNPRARAWINLLGSIVFLIPFCLAVIYFSYPFVASSVASLETSLDPGGLARWPLKIAIPVAFALMALQGVSAAIHAAAVLAGREPGRAAPDHGGEA